MSNNTIVIINNPDEVKAMCVNCHGAIDVDFTNVGGNKNSAVICNNCRRAFFLSVDVTNILNGENAIGECAHRVDYDTASEFARNFSSNVLAESNATDTSSFYIISIIHLTHIGVPHGNDNALAEHFPEFFVKTNINKVKDDIYYRYYQLVPEKVLVPGPEGAYESVRIVDHLEYIGYCASCHNTVESSVNNLLR